MHFLIQSQLAKGEEIAICPSCSLLLRVIYDMVSLLFLSKLGESIVLTSFYHNFQMDYEDDSESEDEDVFEEAVETIIPVL